jgi:type IV secretory pathway VirB2 component (pilin)
MNYLGLAFTLAVLAVNLWGLMLLVGLYLRNRWFALVSGPILGVTAMYAI